ncbi:UbiX family flavin prenyltransferase [Clostridium felsineum]|uniref:Flavin prenyltransferase UbiX n=1 Tax=Clostridium felsineum TaxID=36839 RepID=A0A1S8KX99_9CLOT|nr:UbiX family flavin prenyltransferase [Clostridium felsineum]URZ07025.1 Flavin prenyltransferase UbiX [Clostridium felsineum]URZ12055.1 Flavin prenyltransferase UbiX [Clostridium felsineum]
MTSIAIRIEKEMFKITKDSKKLIVGITGASGIIYGTRILEILKELNIETHLIVSKAAEITLALETEMQLKDLYRLASITYSVDDIGAAVSSGSFQNMGMIIAPCSIKTLSQIAYSINDNLITRAADVTLKERRRLVLMVRETPYNLSHIRSIEAVMENGAIVFPPVPAFYTKPKTVMDIVDQSIGRALDLLGIDTGKVKRWA